MLKKGWFFAICFLLSPMVGISQDASEMSRIKGGSFIPLYGSDSSMVEIDEFFLDTYPVTNKEFLEFVIENPKWRKSKVIELFAEGNYLIKWVNDSTISTKLDLQSPVTTVSWYAAKAYCECQEKRLPK